MKVGIVGFAGAGKTTIFNALTGLAADTGLGGRRKTNLGMIKVPDGRVDFLASVFEPKKKTYAEVGFVDVPGPEAAATKSGMDLGLVTQMRDMDALVNVVRGFDSPGLKRGPDPLRDLTDLEAELVLTDLLQVEGRLQRLAKEGNKNLQDKHLMERLRGHLEQGLPLRVLELSDAERQSVGGFAFLSIKPCLLLLNQAEEDAAAALPEALCGAAGQRDVDVIGMAGAVEAEIARLPPEDQLAFAQDLGMTAPARDRFVTTTYRKLSLISFLTCGPDDCHAWAIRRGTAAKPAAGKVHSDIERGFIRAEVISFADFEQHPSEAECRARGKLRLEGRDYVLQDGDIVNFRFNV